MTHIKAPRCYTVEEQAVMAQRLIDEGWACFPPDSGVAELVEAAKRWSALSQEYIDAIVDESHDDESELGLQVDKANGALWDAARKVAKEQTR